MRDELIETIEYKENYRIKIYRDDDAESPREWENIGTMVCWHRRYRLGDKHNFKEVEDFQKELFGKDEYEKLDEQFEEKFAETYNMDSSIEADKKRYELRKEFSNLVWEGIYAKNVILPLYLYDHSGISISTGRGYPYNDPWDSGQVGWIYCSNEKALEEYGELKQVDSAEDLKQARKNAENHLEIEVKTYNQYLTGEVFRYETFWTGDEEEEIDSCSGFFGDQYDKENTSWFHMIEDAKSNCDYDEKRRFPLLKPLLAEQDNADR